MAGEMQLISADNEWSPLKAVIVGRVEHSIFPAEPRHAMEAIMPEEHVDLFRPNNPFSEDLLEKAQRELDNFAAVLEQHGVRIYRPKEVDWLKVGGYTGSMPRDALMTVGNTLIESPFPWRCRRYETRLAYSDILDELTSSGSGRICRVPLIVGRDTIYDGMGDDAKHENNTNGNSSKWAINNSRPAFDTADFMRFGKTILEQISNVTNEKGVRYLQAIVPEGYTVEILEAVEEHVSIHLDTTILPHRQGLLVYSPERVTEEALRQHAVFEDWELHAYPFTPKPRGRPSPPSYMCSPWSVLNAISLDEKHIFVDELNTEFVAWVQDEFGMEPILLPFQHVNSIGGRFTVLP